MLANQVVGAEDPHLFDVPPHLDDLDPLKTELDECKRKLAIAVDALKHYANDDNWSYEVHDSCQSGTITEYTGPAADDGKVAKEALSKIRGEKGQA